MAAGYFTNQFGQKMTISDSSCPVVMNAAAVQHTLQGVVNMPFACSTDPVIVGSRILFRTPTGSYSGAWTVAEITATPKFSVEDQSVFVLIIAYCLLFVFGFHSGVIHGNR